MECDARRVKVFQSRLCAQAWVGGICYGNPVGVLRLVAARAQVWKGPSGDSSSRPYARNPDGFSGFLFCFRLGVCGRAHPPRFGCGVGMVRDARARGRRRARTGHGMRDARQRAGTGSMRGRRRRIRPPGKRGTRGARMRKGIRAPVLSGGEGLARRSRRGAEKASRGPVRSSRRQPYGTRRCCRRAHSFRARRIRRRCCGRR